MFWIVQIQTFMYYFQWFAENEKSIGVKIIYVRVSKVLAFFTLTDII